METRAAEQVPSGLRYLKGIGPKRSAALEKVGVHSLRDLLQYYPRRYEDRSHFKKIAHIQPGDNVTLKGQILAVTPKRFRRMLLLEVILGDDSGMIPAVWFNQPYLKNQFTPGREVIFFGKADFYQGRFQMNSPEYEILENRDAGIHTGRITPIYPLTEGLYQKSLRALIHDVLQNHASNQIEEIFPVDFLSAQKLMSREKAVREIHFPATFETLENARRRMVFEEFLLFEVTLLEKIRVMRNRFRAHALKSASDFQTRFREMLPFTLTEGQIQALSEISSDLVLPAPMNRLLMGDVGSGKTVLAAFALLTAAMEGRQGALLVPTEVLAFQHHETLSRFFKPFGKEIKLLTAGTDSSARARLIAELKKGKISTVVGTHALLQEDVQFDSLSVVVVDEQHKFGVRQRCRLLERTPRPHQLVMTATPIPRTLALTVYGDLDVSIMKGLPKGRKPVKTYWISRAKQPQVYEHILKKMRRGEQAYIIFPMIEETEKTDLLAAVNEFKKFQKGIFREIRLGLVHGKMRAEERDGTMRDFKEGRLQLLVATSVIEVGVDNPQATVMVIENAERFGLSQLHQMRGRIGRGDKDSECFLFGDPQTEEGKKRLRILTKVQDGFEIAEQDLRLRGPGDFWGVRQSGEPLFRLADPVRDEALLLEARQTAAELVQSGQLQEPGGAWAGLKNYLDQFPIHY